MDKLFELTQVAIKGHELSFKANGQDVVCDRAKILEALTRARAEPVARIIVDPVGVWFYWTELDEDLSVNGILKTLAFTCNPLSTRRARAKECLGLMKSERLFRFHEAQK